MSAPSRAAPQKKGPTSPGSPGIRTSPVMFSPVCVFLFLFSFLCVSIPHSLSRHVLWLCVQPAALVWISYSPAAGKHHALPVAGLRQHVPEGAFFGGICSALNSNHMGQIICCRIITFVVSRNTLLLYRLQPVSFHLSLRSAMSVSILYTYAWLVACPYLILYRSLPSLYMRA